MKKRIIAGFLSSMLILGNIAPTVYANENETETQSFVSEESSSTVIESSKEADIAESENRQETSGDESNDSINYDTNQTTIESQNTQSFEADEINTEYTASVDLLQNGDFVSQHFCSNSTPMLLSEDVDWEIELKNRLYAAMGAGEVSVYVRDLGINKNTDADKLWDIYQSSIRGNRYYVTGGYSYTSYQDGTIGEIRIKYSPDFCNAAGQPDPTIINASLRAFNSAADKAIAFAAQGRDELEQMLLAHEWLVRECDYDYENLINDTVPDVSFNAYGCLVNGSAVCNGYALAYSYILEELGYESYIAASDAMNHAWNMVSIDGEWYHVDVTWDDPVFIDGVTYHNYRNDNYSDEGFVGHTYFMKSDSEFMELNHYGWGMQNSNDQLPVANHSGAYADTIIDTCDAGSELLFINDNWYYTKDHSIILQRPSLWNLSDVRYIFGLLAPVMYPHSFNGKIYYTDFKQVLCYDLEKNTIENVANAIGVISELTIKKGELIYVDIDQNGERITRESIDLTEDDSISVTGSIKASSGDLNNLFIDVYQNDELIEEQVTSEPNYTLSNLEPGKYTICVSSDGFLPAEFEITVGEDMITQDIVLWNLMDCAALCEASLSLEGQIGVNLIVNISNFMLQDTGAYAELTQEGSSNPPLKVKLNNASVDSATGNRIFTYPVAAKEINDKITIRIYSGSGEQLPLRGKADRSVELSGNKFSYAAADYINSKKNSSGTIGSLMKALSDYGTAAEKYFQYGNMGATGITADLSSVTQSVLSPYKAVGSGDRLDGVSVSASLMLESMTSINVNYSISGTLSDYTFTCDGKTVTPVKTGNEYQVTVADIAAKDLDQMHVFSISDKTGKTQTVKYSALSYAYSKVNSTGDVVTIAKTLYLYNQAAKGYFGA